MCALVTGVQACALPIFDRHPHAARDRQPDAAFLHRLACAIQLDQRELPPAAVAEAEPLVGRPRRPAVDGRTLVERIAKAERPRRPAPGAEEIRSEEHTSELQSLMRNSYAVFCLKKKNQLTHNRL